MVDLARRIAVGHAREAEQHPQDDGRKRDNRPRAFQERHGPLPKAERQVTRRRPLVFGHLHHEALGIALRHGSPEQQRGNQRAEDSCDIKREENQPLQADPGQDADGRNERRDDDRVNRQTRRTSHQWRDQDGRQPILGILDRPRRHDTGNRTGKARQQRNEGAARQADRRHQPVHQERGADHVPARLQHQDEGEQDDNLRQEHDDCAHARDHAVGEQGPEKRVRHRRLDAILQAAHPAVDHVLRHRCQRENRLEHHEQQRGEDDRSHDRVQHHLVDALGKTPRGAGFHGDAFRDPPRMALAFGERRFLERHMRLVRCAGQHAVERGFQFVQPALAHCDRRDHWYAQRLLQCGDVDRQPIALCEVEHVERNDDRSSQRDQFDREAQVVVEVGRIDNDDQDRGRPLAILLAHDRIAGHAFVRGRGDEAIRTGQVDQFDRPSVGHDQPSGMALYSDARIIADFLAGTGQRVEQCGLAGIRIADQRHHRRFGSDNRRFGVHRTGATEIAPAWARRIATVIRPIRTASGSRATRPAPCSGSTATPSSKPSSRKRRPSRSVIDDQSIVLIVASWSKGRSASVTCERLSVS